MANIATVAQRVLPTNTKIKLRAALKLMLLNREDYTNIVLARLGIAKVFAGYNKMLDYVEASKIYELEGDFLEIGAFMGGGSALLAEYAAPHHKRLIVIDVFDPGFDASKNIHGAQLNRLYRLALGHKNQREIFNQTTARFAKIIDVYAEDSKKVKLPEGRKLCFSFIDGNHEPEYVRSDFNLAWSATVPGGVVSIHDYVEGGGDLPEVTQAVDQLMAENKDAIGSTLVMQGYAIIMIRKKVA